MATTVTNVQERRQQTDRQTTIRTTISTTIIGERDSGPDSPAIAGMEMTNTDAVRGATPQTFLGGNLDETVQQFFAANPDIFKAFVSFALQILEESSRENEQLLLNEKHARDTHSMLLKIVANSELDLKDSSNIPQSTVTAVKRIVDSQYKVPLESALPLLWSADPDNPTTTPGGAPRHPVRDADDSFSSDDSSHEGTQMNELVHRLAVSKDPNFTYPPQLFKLQPPAVDGTNNAAPRSATTLPNPLPWSYGNIYRVKYPDATTVDDACKELVQSGLKLPETVLDLGRLVVTSDSDENPDGSSWSPSDYTVMVDVEAEGKPVWLLSDRHVISRLRRLNYRDGMTVDIDAVRSLFDWHSMDMALLFPRIDDWESSDNSWSALRARISKTSMKLGLRLENL